MHETGERTAQHGARYPDQQNTPQYEKRSGPPLPPSEPPRQLLLEGVKDNREDQGPQDQAEKGLEDAHAHNHQDGNQAKADHHFH